MADEKYFTTQFNTSVDIIGSVTQLSLVPFGSGAGEHTGPYITPTKLEMHLNFTTVSSDVWNFVRLVLFQWHPNSGAPALSSILAPGYSGSTRDTTSPYNKDYEKDYNIIWDSNFFVIGASSATPTSKSCHTERLTISNRFRKIRYNPGATTGENQLFLLAISDSTAIPHPPMFGTTRLFYNDM